MSDDTTSTSDEADYDTGHDIAHKVSFNAQTIPSYLYKYWKQRYQLFSRFDEGVWLNEEMWYSVTPEAVAREIASHVYINTNPAVVLDAFGGAGGNAIQFAMLVDKVILIEKDPITMRCAKHNALVYGVVDKIEFILGDFFDYAPKVEADIVFLSPPWGGPSYMTSAVFDLQTMKPYNLQSLLKASRMITPHVAVFLPRNSNLPQLRESAYYEETEESDGVCMVSYLHIRGRCKGLCAYYNALAVASGQNFQFVDTVSYESIEASGFADDS
ncbi:RNA cap guanine-N2 methyltransferase-domain-containing protein [Lipomyces arxii]|uniref:RNA cap guanine-N2 methyltransferase-domain-containing protein n=1 Tax=Lipomyces arxii TaxID=56418 RepID=UPI0034CFBE5E